MVYLTEVQDATKFVLVVAIRVAPAPYVVFAPVNQSLKR